jgi:hypothetical protein
MTNHLPRRSLTLSHQALAYLQSLRYWRETVRLFCLSSVGGIYWRNEIPDPNQFETLSADDQCVIWRLFAIRVSIWNRGALAASDKEFWETSRRQVPNCPLFQRLGVSQHERQEDYRVDRRRPTFREGLRLPVDHVTMSGIQTGIHPSFRHFVIRSATKQSWLARIMGG